MSGYLKAENGVFISFEDNKEFPKTTNVTKSASWTPVAPITSFAPILGFSSSTPFVFTLTIRFSIEEGPVMPRVKQCRSLVVPDYGSGMYRPPSITVTVENYIESFKGVASSVSEVLDDNAAWINGEPSIVDVSISLEECDTKPQPNLYGK